MGELQTVEAESFGDWALIDVRNYPDLGQGYRWNITHVPTGSRAAWANTKKEAVAFIQFLQRLDVRWPTSKMKSTSSGSFAAINHLSKSQKYRIRKKAAELRINVSVHRGD